jgi:esterase/lipase superfamily enzyme
MSRGLVILVALVVVAGARVDQALRRGQDAGPVRQVRVGANASAHSDRIELARNAALTTVQSEPPSPASDGAVRVYVLDATDVVVGMDDPEEPARTFTWTAPKAGAYRLLITNSTPAPVTVTIRSGERGPLATPASTATGATVRVWYATNRTRLLGTMPTFGTDPATAMSYGYADVGIPRDHRMGEIEAPSIWRLEFREDPVKHVTVLSLEDEREADFLTQIGKRSSQSAARQMLVFVHGFNEAFDAAIKRTAQIAYDLAFDGPAIAFSWPSQGRLTPLDYTKDERNADVSAAALSAFLMRLRGASDRVTIHVIAHSMGNRVLTRALESASATFENGAKLKDLVLMAPDVDAALFRQAAGRIAATAERVTLYASSQDLALKAAHRVSGYTRAGEGGADVLVVPGIDTVDASSVETSAFGLGHSYYADNSTILSDVFGLIRNRRPEERFGLEKLTTTVGSYWRFRPAAR